MPILLASLDGIRRQFIEELLHTGPLEFVAVTTGIISVWLSKKEKIGLYPTGIISTVIYVFLSMEGHLFGEASVNFYYTVVSIYGWVLWTRKHPKQDKPLVIRTSDKKEWRDQLVFFGVFYIALFAALSFLKANFSPAAIPWADALASATAYTGMWLMARKKVESWYWWIATDIASVPLYFVKGYVFTSFYYLLLLGIAYTGLKAWMKKTQTEIKPG